MKVFRKLVTQHALTPLVPIMERLDSALLCLMHCRSSRRGIKMLRDSSCAESERILTAIKTAVVNKAVERERARLLARKALLDPEGPFDKGISVSAACAISKSPRQAALLGSIVKAFTPGYALELGTNVGISSAYIGSSMTGALVTLEASPSRQVLAKGVHSNLGISNVDYVLGLFEDTLDDVLTRLPQVDFAFIDGHHEYRPTLDYFERIVKRARPGSVFVFDDINWSEGMIKAWSKLKMDERFGLVADFWTVGVCVLRSDQEPRVVTEPITCY